MLAGGGSALAVLGSGALARPSGGSLTEAGGGAALLLIDTALPGWRAAAEVAGRAGVPFAQFAGDLGSVWLERLEPVWRHAPSAIAGVTFGGALFCAEQLARGRGLVRSLCLPVSPGSSLREWTELAIAQAARPAGSLELAGAVRDDRPVAWALVPHAGPAKRSGASS